MLLDTPSFTPEELNCQTFSKWPYFCGDCRVGACGVTLASKYLIAILETRLYYMTDSNRT
jgi:hypothetical protein